MPKIPRQWKLIAIYMLLVYLVFLAEYQYAKRQAATPDFAAEQVKDAPSSK